MNRNRRLVQLAVAVLAVLNAVSCSEGQVFDTGPSDPSLFVNGVYNISSASAREFLDSLQQLNLFNRGDLDFNFHARSQSEVNIYAGNVGAFFEATDSEVNILGGFVGNSFSAAQSQVNIRGGLIAGGLSVRDASELNISGGELSDGFRASSTSVVNVSGGKVGNRASLSSGSTANISGGTIGGGFNAPSGTSVTISGGTVGPNFRARSGSNSQLVGGEFRLNGAPYADATITLGPSDVFSGAFADGTAFIFCDEATDVLSGTTLVYSPPAPARLDPIFVSTPVTDEVSGLRAGQTLTVQPGGLLNENFAVVDSTLNVNGGNVGLNAEVTGGVVNITAGILGGGFHALTGSVVNINGGYVAAYFGAYTGSVVNISGGTIDREFIANSGSVLNIRGAMFDDSFRALSGSSVHLSGAGFTLNGAQLDNLAPGQTFIVEDKSVTVAGQFADGTPFSFRRGSFSSGTTLTITLVPEAGSLSLIIAGVFGLVARSLRCHGNTGKFRRSGCA